MRAAPATPLLLLAVLALGACSTTGLPASFADPVENAQASTTLYDFEFRCAYADGDFFRISGETRWIDDADGYRSRIVRLSKGRKAVAQHWIEEINKRIPDGAYQERPWVVCSGGGAEIELRFMDRSNGTVAGLPRVMFTLHSDGTLEFRD
ncbi:hypothetical protein bcgnr5379_62390 [Bacillus cereus]